MVEGARTHRQGPGFPHESDVDTVAHRPPRGQNVYVAVRTEHMHRIQVAITTGAPFVPLSARD
jgi:hypothetical protein